VGAGVLLGAGVLGVGSLGAGVGVAVTVLSGAGEATAGALVVEVALADDLR